MAKFSSKDVGFFLLGGYSILAATSKIEDTVELNMTETPVLGESDEGWWSSGAKKTTVEQDGWFDDSTGSIHEALVALPVTALPMSLAPKGNTNGLTFDGYQSVQRVGYDVVTTVGEVTKAKGRYGIWYGKKEGIIVHALGTESTAGNSDSLDVMLTSGASPAGTNGGAIFTHVTATGGGTPPTNVIFALRDSADGITYTDKSTAYATITTASVPADSATYYAFTGTIKKYASVAWSYTGGASPTVTFFVGVYVAP